MKPYIFEKYNLQITGNLNAPETLIFAHGYGSNQLAWRFITPAFETQYRLVLFDMVGCGNSDVYAFNLRLYNSLHHYVEDLIEICDGLHLQRVHLIAHSVGSIIGTLAAMKRPDLFSSFVFIGASPCYLDDDDYIGGFDEQQLNGLLLKTGRNYIEWLDDFAPIAMNIPDQPELIEEFANSLADMEPGIAIFMAQTIFSCDHRLEISQLKLPVLILQSKEDVIVPPQVGEYLHQVIQNSYLQWISGPGHLPHMSNPDEIIKAITEHFQRLHQDLQFQH